MTTARGRRRNLVAAARRHARYAGADGATAAAFAESYGRLLDTYDDPAQAPSVRAAWAAYVAAQADDRPLPGFRRRTP